MRGCRKARVAMTIAAMTHTEMADAAIAAGAETRDVAPDAAAAKAASEAAVAEASGTGASAKAPVTAAADCSEART